MNYYIEPTSAFEYAAFAENAPFWVTHTKAWSTVLERSFPHIRGYIAADSKIIGPDTTFLPVFRVKSPLKKPSWVSIPFSTVCDPVLKDKGDAEGLFRSLSEHPVISRNRVEIRSRQPLLKTGLFTPSSGYVNHQLRLDREEDEIFRSFHRTAVQVHIRKSLASGVTLKLGTSLQDVVLFYKIYITMRREIGLPPQPFRFFKNMWSWLSPDNVELLLAEHEGKVVSGMWVLKNRWLYSFEYLARAGSCDKLRCGHFLYWQGIRRALQSKTAYVSFGRTSARNTGLDQFKRRWGTEVVSYHDYIYPDTIGKAREDRYVYKIIRSSAQRLPLPAFRLLGEIIYCLI